MNNLLKTFLFMCIVVGGLLLLQLLPEMEIFGYEIRPVSLFSEITADNDFLPEQFPDSLSTANDQQPTTNNQQPPSATLSDEGLEIFYQRLMEIDTLSRPVRIAYFGDSFIEGDIMTSDLRAMLQEYFGGAGVGFMDVDHPTANIRATAITSCRNFSSHAVIDKEGFHPALSGIDMIYAIPTDTLASFSLSMPGKKEAQVSSVYYFNHPDVDFTAKADGKDIDDADTLTSENIAMTTIDSPMKRVVWNFHLACGDDTLKHFDLPRCPVFGAAMEDKNGIVLDNFSLRGNSGTALSKVPEKTLRNFMSLRHYDLIILGYGLNVASPKVKSYDYYTQQMQKIIERFIKASPETSIMIIGVGDRAEKTEKGITTRPEIILLNESQKQLAQSMGCAFWNLYLTMKEMGGIKAMAETTPALANKDYTHINRLGGKHLAEKLFQDILNAFNRYKQKIDEEKNNNITPDYSY